jgi:hypothetical protein
VTGFKCKRRILALYTDHVPSTFLFLFSDNTELVARMCDSTSHDVRATSSTDLSLSDALVQLKHLVLDNRDFPAEDAAVEVEDHRLRM